MAKVKLGIIGVGNMGTGHSKNYLDGLMPEIEITAVADRSAARREWAKENLPGVKVFEEGVDLIHSGACEAVLIATPHYQLPPLAIEAFKNGPHVMVEKPAGVYTLQVREMNAEADRHPELTFGMMFNQRTNCVYRKAKELIDSGALGEIKRMIWVVTDWYRTQSYYDAGAWRATWDGEGGGVLALHRLHPLAHPLGRGLGAECQIERTAQQWQHADEDEPDDLIVAVLVLPHEVEGDEEAEDVQPRIHPHLSGGEGEEGPEQPAVLQQNKGHCNRGPVDDTIEEPYDRQPKEHLRLPRCLSAAFLWE